MNMLNGKLLPIL